MEPPVGRRRRPITGRAARGVRARCAALWVFARSDTEPEPSCATSEGQALPGAVGQA